MSSMPAALRRLGASAAIAAALVVGSTMGAATAADEFTISGEIDGIFPGWQGTLPAQVTNPFDVAIRVTSVAGTAADAGQGCPGSLLTIAEAPVDIDVAPGSSITVPLDVGLARSAPDACQGATFEITFRGTAIDPSPGDAPTATDPPLGDAATATDRPAQALALTGANAFLPALAGFVIITLGALLARRHRSRVVL